MRTSSLVAILAAGLLLAGCSAAPAAAPGGSAVATAADPSADAMAFPGDLDAAIATAVAQLPGVVERMLAASGVPGAAVAVVHGGETVYAAGFGAKAAGEADPVDEETVFPLASLSKSLTATLIARAVTEGVVDWSTPVHDLLPTFSLEDPYVTAHGTIGDYMSHRTGLYTGAGDDLESIGYGRDYVLEHLHLLPLDAFRSSYNYSNYGITVAAAAVAAAYGEPWDDLIENELFKPVGMTSTSARHADYLARPDRATINALVDGTFQPLYDRDADPQAPAGGVSSNVVDLAEWLKVLIADGELDGEAFLAPEAIDPAITPQVVTGHPSSPEAKAGTYGFGFNTGVTPNGRTTFSHSGAFVVGVGANFRVIPSLDLGIVVLTNGSPVGVAEAIASTFLDTVQFGATTRDWAAAFAQATSHYLEPSGDLIGATRPADAASPGPLADYAGTYSNTYFGDLVVSVDGDRLVGRLGPDGVTPIEFQPWNGDTFAVALSGEEEPPGSLTSAEFTRSDTSPSVTIQFFDRWGLGTWTRQPGP